MPPVRKVVLMKRIIQAVTLGATLSTVSLMASGAEVSSTALTLDPKYDVAGCALVTSNGYGGTDRQLFIPTVDGYYSVKDYSDNAGTIWIITAEAFDPATRLVDQALASNSPGVGAVGQAYITAGTRVFVWSAYTGGYGTVNDCQADGATKTVTMRVVGEDSGVPSAPTGLTASATDGGAVISFTAGSANGSAITNYQFGTFNGFNWTYTALTPADSASPITISGFTNGSAATVRLKAVNANGTSTDSAAVTFTPQAAPAQPVPGLPATLLLLLTALVGWWGGRRLKS